jgi:hypothetical protein
MIFSHRNNGNVHVKKSGNKMNKPVNNNSDPVKVMEENSNRGKQVSDQKA